jgi:signal recognition particle receptor subunit beta
MDWSSPGSIATNLLAGNLVAIVVACILAFSLPLILHISLYRTTRADSSSDFFLLGPSGSGKTALCSLVSIF